ncbi:MAG: shikimate dehydrogenase [Desulfococcaceae bacterium]|jgi:shikimate dehydrogenase|nr:shikimate dehydrogenase [Desulfococcaceae bacterium]
MQGQTPIRDPRKKIEKKVFCILSDERAFRSKSPAMFNKVLRRTGIDGIYVPFMVEPGHIEDAVKGLRALNIAGANVTLPYKESVLPLVDVLSEGANIIGAINTIARDREILKGYNTNAIGFMDALEEAGFETAGKSALVFGNGGAARAVVFMLNWLRAGRIMVAGRSKEKTGRIISRIGGQAVDMESVPESPVQADIVINATSVSEEQEGPELAGIAQKMQIPDCRLLIDLNYGRDDCFWEKIAKEKNIHYMDGLPILANQARRSFALWTGLDLEPEEFLNALKSDG